MGSAAHGSHRDSRGGGRHKAPAQSHRVPRLAAWSVPAVAMVGALAAFPQVRDLASGTTAAAGHQAAARAVDHGATGSTFADDATSFRNETRWSQRAKTASGSSAVRSAVAAERAARARARRRAATGREVPVCAATGGMLPENATAIVDFLVAHGYTGTGAAGLAGNIYQESGGDPESGGSGAGGLIGWTPLPAGYVTGDASADLQTQLAGILSFDDRFAQDLPALNDAASPAAAADIYVIDFEHASNPAAGTREESADAVAAACQI